MCQAVGYLCIEVLPLFSCSGGRSKEIPPNKDAIINTGFFYNQWFLESEPIKVNNVAWNRGWMVSIEIVLLRHDVNMLVDTHVYSWYLSSFPLSDLY